MSERPVLAPIAIVVAALVFAAGAAAPRRRSRRGCSS